MEKAVDLPGILRAVKPEPLKGKDFENFFVETDKARGDRAAMFLEKYFKANRDDEPQKVLFMGHRGSGKSTELYRVGTYLEETFKIINFSIRDEIDITDLQYVDLIFVILNKLYEEAITDKISIDDRVLENLERYWRDERFLETLKVEKASIETGAQLKGGFWDFIRLHVKGILSTGTEYKDVVRQYIKPRLSQFLTGTNDFIDNVTMAYKQTGKMPLLILEDLDKLDIAVAEELFLKRKNILTGFNIHIIYTFPIFLHYSGSFNEIAGVFDHHKLLSMLKVSNKDESPNETGREIIRKIVEKRADRQLFQPEALDFLIEKSGGSLRHLFDMLKNAALNAWTGDSEATVVNLSAAKQAYREFQSRFERTIARKHLDTLKEVYVSPDKKPMPTDDLKDMLNCMAVIEYNGDRWCGLHPAVVDFLKEKGEIGDATGTD